MGTRWDTTSQVIPQPSLVLITSTSAAASLLIALPQPSLQDTRRHLMESLILAHSLTRIRWYRVTQPPAQRDTRSRQHFQKKKKKSKKKQKRRKEGQKN